MARRTRVWGACLGMGLGLLVACGDDADPVLDGGDAEADHDGGNSGSNGAGAGGSSGAGAGGSSGAGGSMDAAADASDAATDSDSGASGTGMDAAADASDAPDAEAGSDGGDADAAAQDGGQDADAGGTNACTGNGSTIRLVRDIVAGDVGSNPSAFTPFDGLVYFIATTPNEGAELWRTDGTEGGTTRTSDINPGPANAFASPYLLVAAADMLYFRATSDVYTSRLWFVSSTLDTLGIVTAAADKGAVGQMLALGSRLYFVVGSLLYVVDGGSVTTVNYEGTDEPIQSGFPMAVFDNHLFLRASVQDEVLTGLFRISAGNVDEATLAYQEPGFSFQPSFAARTIAGSTLYMMGTDIDGDELWSLSSAFDTPFKIKDINPGFGGGLMDLRMLAFGNKLAFRADDGTHGPELWISEGAELTTLMLDDVRVGAVGSDPSPIFVLGDELYFSASPAGPGSSTLYRTDGIPGPAEQVAYLAGNGHLVVNDQVYFIKTTPECGRELWVSDGTEAGTELVQDLDPGVGNGVVAIYRIGNRLYVSGSNGTSGFELFVFDLP